MPDAHWLNSGAGVAVAFASAACAPYVAAKYSDSVMQPIISASLMNVNSATRIPILSTLLNNDGVQKIEQIYRTRLQLLVDEAGSQTALAKKIDKSPAQVSQWINASKDSKTGKPRSMDRETARSIERALGKPDGWMDQPIIDGLSRWPFPGIDPARFENLTPEQKIEIRGVVRNMINGFEAERGNALRNGTDP